jgi:hypothetical protein
MTVAMWQQTLPMPPVHHLFSMKQNIANVVYAQQVPNIDRIGDFQRCSKYTNPKTNRIVIGGHRAASFCCSCDCRHRRCGGRRYRPNTLRNVLSLSLSLSDLTTNQRMRRTGRCRRRRGTRRRRRRSSLSFARK